MNKVVIVPSLGFSCNGRITNIKAQVIERSDDYSYSSYSFPSFQVWRPSSVNPSVYDKTHKIQLQTNDQVNNNNILNIKLTGDKAIEFRSGDIIGYYHPRGSCYLVAHINNTIGYKLYLFDKLLRNLAAVNISEATEVKHWKQPLLQFKIGINQLPMCIYINHCTHLALYVVIYNFIIIP